MAFISKVGNILKQSASAHVNYDSSAHGPFISQAIRSMSSKLFVGGLSYSTDDISLREAFANYGEIIEARVILDRDSGRSRGFGFVSFASSDEASSAMQGMDGTDLHGRKIRVNYAVDKFRGGFGGPSSWGGGANFGNAGNFSSGGYGGGVYGGGSSGSGYGYGHGGGGYNAGGRSGGSGYGGSSGGGSAYSDGGVGYNARGGGSGYGGGSAYQGDSFNRTDYGLGSEGNISVSGGIDGTDFNATGNRGFDGVVSNERPSSTPGMVNDMDGGSLGDKVVEDQLEVPKD